MSRSKNRVQKISPEVIRAQGGRAVTLDPMVQAMPDPDTTRSGWFGPGQPMNPSAPAELVAGRRNDFPANWNMSMRPRAYEPIGFAELRAMADGYDLLRLAIETRKDQIARLRFNIVPIDEAVRKKMTPEMRERAKRIEDLLRRPDRDKFWSTWIRDLLEDLLVIDAPSIHMRRTVGGDIYSLDQIDGGTIKRVIDEFGRTPEPPYAAYQQILHGLPAVNYSRRDLMYKPRNMRVHKFYGYSPVEQVVMTVNIALRRQMWQLAYFTDGNIPDSLIGVPSTWTPDQIRQFQDWFDSILQGDTRRRRGGLFVPGEVAKSYVPTKEAEIFGAAEEWMARVICYCFGLSHQALVKQMNRAAAESAREEAIQDGMAPIMNWIKELIDSFLIDEMDETELEFVWTDDKELDPKTQSEILTAYVSKGIISRNSAREQLGEDPDTAPEADLLCFDTATGPVPIDLEQQIQLKQRMQDAFPPPPQLGGPEVDENVPPKPGDTEDSAGAALAGGEGGDGADDAKSPPAPDKKKANPFAKAASPAEGLPGSIGRPLARRAQRAVAKSVARVLAALGVSVVSVVKSRLATAGLAKAEEDETMSAAAKAALVESIMEDIELGGLDVLMDVMKGDLEALAMDTGRIALAQMGVEDKMDLVERVNQRAVRYATERSAELVGKRVLEDGSIIDNPNAKWAIDESTRDMIRETISGALEENLGSDAIVKSLEDDYAFSPERADMVSRTEIAMANSEAALEAYEVAADAGVDVQKAWILGPDPCPICQGNADQGTIGLGEEFDSGDDGPPAHPNCECAVVPIVGGIEESE